MQLLPLGMFSDCRVMGSGREGSQVGSGSGQSQLEEPEMGDSRG